MFVGVVKDGRSILSSHIGTLSMKDGATDRLTDIKGPMKYRVTSTAYDPEARKLFFAADNNVKIRGGAGNDTLVDAFFGPSNISAGNKLKIRGFEA